MGGMSLMHWLILGAIGLIVFGPSRLPDLGKSLGQAIRGFKKGLEEGETEENPAQLQAQKDKEKKSTPESH